MYIVHDSHDTRISDAGSFDEICKNCGATDARGTGTLHLPCPKATEKVTEENKNKLSEESYRGE